MIIASIAGGEPWHPNYPRVHSIPNYVLKMFLVKTKLCSYVIGLSEVLKGTGHVEESEQSCSE